METKQTDKRLIVGVLIVLLGAILLASNFGVLPYSIKRYLLHWEMILIGVGLIALITNEHKGTGIILIVVGGAFYLRNFFDLHFNFWQLFVPSMIILVGLLLIFRRRVEFKGGESTSKEDNDILDDVSIFGGGDKILDSQNFQGGKITAIFGGSNINMTNVKLAPGVQYIDVFAVFGGTSLIVPDGWDIQIKVASVFGGFSDKHKVIVSDREDEKKNRLVIKGLVIFGGGEIKSY